MNASVLPPPRPNASAGLHPTDKEIALLAFKHWKQEGSHHLRPEHWLTAEKELTAAYAAQGQAFAPAESARFEPFWELELETLSSYAVDRELSLSTKGWS